MHVTSIFTTSNEIYPTVVVIKTRAPDFAFKDLTGRTSHPMVYEWIFSSVFAKPKAIFERHKTLKYSRTGPKRFMW